MYIVVRVDAMIWGGTFSGKNGKGEKGSGPGNKPWRSDRESLGNKVAKKSQRSRKSRSVVVVMRRAESQKECCWLINQIPPINPVPSGPESSHWICQLERWPMLVSIADLCGPLSVEKPDWRGWKSEWTERKCRLPCMCRCLQISSLGFPCSSSIHPFHNHALYHFLKCKYIKPILFLFLCEYPWQKCHLVMHSKAFRSKQLAKLL